MLSQDVEPGSIRGGSGFSWVEPGSASLLNTRQARHLLWDCLCISSLAWCNKASIRQLHFWKTKNCSRIPGCHAGNQCRYHKRTPTKKIYSSDFWEYTFFHCTPGLSDSVSCLFSLLDSISICPCCYGRSSCLRFWWFCLMQECVQSSSHMLSRSLQNRSALLRCTHASKGGEGLEALVVWEPTGHHWCRVATRCCSRIMDCWTCSNQVS